MRSKTHDIAEGSFIDERFQILGVLGKGGFATVYRARQVNIGRDVAIKILSLDSNDSQQSTKMQMRLMREARSAASIEHPDIVGIHDVGVTPSGAPYIAMEMLKGHDLSHELHQIGSMKPERLLPLMCRCLDALAAAHDKGVVHKDLKPSNLFLTNPGTLVEALKILDFGIAALLGDQEQRLTGTGQYLGTIRYSPREYIEHQIVSPALDVYQMGLILVEALTGSPVVQGQSPVHCVHIHATGRLPVPKILVESPLGPVIAQALALDPAERYADAGAFRDALMAVDAGALPVVAYDGPTELLCDFSASMRGGVTVPNPSVEPPAPAPVELASKPKAVFEAAPEPEDISESPAPLPRSGLSKGKLAVLVVAAVLMGVLLAGGSMLLGMWGAPEAQKAAVEPRKPARTKGDESQEANRGDSKGQGASTLVLTSDKAALEKVEVTLKASPQGARIEQGGQLLGTGQAVVEFASAEAEPVDVTVSLPGYVSKRVKVAPGQETPPVVRLEKIQRAVDKGRKPPVRPVKNVEPKKEPAAVKKPEPVKSGGDKKKDEAGQHPTILP